MLEVPSKILSAQELEITEHKSVVELAKKIAEKKYTSVDVVTAYCKRAAIAHQLVLLFLFIFLFILFNFFKVNISFHLLIGELSLLHLLRRRYQKGS